MPAGSHSPLGWAAVLLIAVAYAHVLTELVVAVLAIAVAVRVLLAAPARDLLRTRARRHQRLERPRSHVVAIGQRPREEARRRRASVGR